jgi:DNA modification methylase
VWEFKRTENKLHPTMKPVPLIANALLTSTKGEEVVLDLFGGSGSTLIACEQLNRKCRMMQLDPHYCDVIIARWEKLTGQKAVKLEG